jgi:predicted amino acid-binding ACT domain protein
MPATNRFIVSVLLPDRVGALRDVTAAIVKLDGNIGGIRQNVVEGFFTLVFCAEHPAPIVAEAIRAELVARLEADAAVHVRPCQGLRAAARLAGGCYVAMTRGEDRPGTIHAISAFFVEYGINIEDWQVELDGADVIYTAQIMIPAAADFRVIQESFRARMQARGLTGTICHENIIRATNEIGPIKELLRR